MRLKNQKSGKSEKGQVELTLNSVTEYSSDLTGVESLPSYEYIQITKEKWDANNYSGATKVCDPPG